MKRSRKTRTIIMKVTKMNANPYYDNKVFISLLDAFKMM